MENIRENIKEKFEEEAFLATHLGHQVVLVNFTAKLLVENETKKNYAMVRLNAPK